MKNHVAKNRPSQPLFKSGNATFKIDSCKPQIKAAKTGLIELHALTNGNYPGEKLPKDTLTGLSSIGWWNAKGAPGWGLESHRNEGLEIVFLETGSMHFIVNDNKYKIQAGNLTVTRPWEKHKLGNPNIGPGKLHWLIIDLSVRKKNQTWKWPKWVILGRNDLQRLTKILSGKKAVIISTSPGIRQIFKSLSSAVTSKSQYRFSAIAVYINDLLLELLKNFSGIKPDEKPSTEASREAILQFLIELEKNEGLCAQPWTLISMAEHCHVGTTFFVERCRETINESPMKYLNSCRLSHANNLLSSHTDKSITEIALASGFGSSQYFATCYRRKFGRTPSDLRHPVSNNKNDRRQT